MTHLEYLKQNAVETKESTDGKFTTYHLAGGFAVYNNKTHKYLWYSDPQPGSRA